MGYTPLYDTMLSGTLYGRWPHTGIWACLLSRASREGLIDETPQSLAGAIGVDVDTLLACIQSFMEPDPDSRSPEHEGRRLALIDPRRTWGWKVLNHGKYREKARKKNYDENRTESGRDAERKKQERSGRPEIDLLAARDGWRCGICAKPVSRDVPRGMESESIHVDHITPLIQGGSNEIDNLQLAHARCNKGKSGGNNSLPWRHDSMPSVPRCPAMSRDVPLSYAEANKSKRPPTTKKPAKAEREIPEDFQLTAELEAKATALGVANPAKEFMKFREYYQAKGTKWKDWSLVWQRWCREVKPESRKNGADPYANSI